MRAPASELRKDRLVALVIRTGGVGVILLVALMVVVIAFQALPLFRGAEVGPATDLGPALTPALGVSGSTPSTWWLDTDGRLVVAVDERRKIADLGRQRRVVAARAEIGDILALLRDDGSATVGKIRQSRGAGGERKYRWKPMAELAPSDTAVGWRGVAAAAAGDELLVVRWASDTIEISTFVEGRAVGESRYIPVSDAVEVAIGAELECLAVVSGDRSLRMADTRSLTFLPVADDGFQVASVTFLAGGRSLVATGDRGAVAIYQETPRVEILNSGATTLRVDGRKIPPGTEAVLPATASATEYAGRPGVSVRRIDPVWRLIHDLEPTRARPTAVATAPRGRSFAVGDAGGEVSLYNATSARMLLRVPWSPGNPVNALAVDPRGTTLVAAAGGVVQHRLLDNPHPEISFRTLFLPVWYEGLAEPRAVWQTSGGGDGFQPKYSLGPLLLGTLKATVYAMLFSVPLALLAALYVSQLAPSWLQSVVKPTVEMMAAVPTVVVGFLAALWLAPRLQHWLFPAAVAALVLPVGVAAALWFWRRLPSATRNRLPEGVELLVLLLGCAAVVGFVVCVAAPLERWLFDGDFTTALFAEWGIRYEQRNGIIIGIALGFAVIPVIFTLAEDALSNVPSSLVQAARALGASRWQAALRLVVPAARPGLVAAVMLGLGRAVGETMIVLMAAGNTPVLDLGPFSGMRTMSAAMAFEMPEAAVGGTLFRVLFLTGFLLFVFSLLFTTAADLVGRRLRRPHAST